MKLFVGACVLACVAVVCSTPASAQTYPVGRQPSVEFSPAPVSGPLKGLANLDLIFRQKPSAVDAAALTRRWMEAVLAAYGRNVDVFATAWFSPTGKKIDEDIISLAEGSQHSDHLLFTAKTNLIHLMPTNEPWFKPGQEPSLK